MATKPGRVGAGRVIRRVFMANKQVSGAASSPSSVAPAASSPPPTGGPVPFASSPVRVPVEIKADVKAAAEKVRTAISDGSAITGEALNVLFDEKNSADTVKALKDWSLEDRYELRKAVLGCYSQFSLDFHRQAELVFKKFFESSPKMSDEPKPISDVLMDHIESIAGRPPVTTSLRRQLDQLRTTIGQLLARTSSAKDCSKQLRAICGELSLTNSALLLDLQAPAFWDSFVAARSDSSKFDSMNAPEDLKSSLKQGIIKLDQFAVDQRRWALEADTLDVKLEVLTYSRGSDERLTFEGSLKLATAIPTLGLTPSDFEILYEDLFIGDPPASTFLEFLRRNTYVQDFFLRNLGQKWSASGSLFRKDSFSLDKREDIWLLIDRFKALGIPTDHQHIHTTDDAGMTAFKTFLEHDTYEELCEDPGAWHVELVSLGGREEPLIRDAKRFVPECAVMEKSLRGERRPESDISDEDHAKLQKLAQLKKELTVSHLPAPLALAQLKLRVGGVGTLDAIDRWLLGTSGGVACWDPPPYCVAAARAEFADKLTLAKQALRGKREDGRQHLMDFLIRVDEAAPVVMCGCLLRVAALSGVVQKFASEKQYPAFAVVAGAPAELEHEGVINEFGKAVTTFLDKTKRKKLSEDDIKSQLSSMKKSINQAMSKLPELLAGSHELGQNLVQYIEKLERFLAKYQQALKDVETYYKAHHNLDSCDHDAVAIVRAMRTQAREVH